MFQFYVGEYLQNSYRPPKANREELKQAVIDFIEHQDYERTYKQLTSSDYVWNFLANKSKQQQLTLKEHVSVPCITSQNFYLIFLSITNRFLGIWECFTNQQDLHYNLAIDIQWKVRKVLNCAQLKNGKVWF
jgi:hypothetical protein